MKTNRVMIILCLCALVLLTCISSAEAANIRGRLDRVTNNGVYPAGGIPVTVFSATAGRSYPAYSDNSGFYFLYNIPPGNYNLEVWITNPPRVSPIQVPPVQQFDVAPIRVQ